MEIQQELKAMLTNARLYFFFAILAAINVQTANGQELKGTYTMEIGVGSGSRTLIFKQGEFIEKGVSDGDQTYGEGMFSLTKKRLTLNYIKTVDPDSSLYTLDSKLEDQPDGYPNKKRAGIVEIEVVTDDNFPTSGMIFTRDKQGNAISMINTDTTGIGNVYLYDNLSLGFLGIGVLGYKSVTISAAKLLGRKSSLKVNLKPDTNHHIEAHTEIYEVLKRTPNKLVLKGEGNSSLEFILRN